MKMKEKCNSKHTLVVGRASSLSKAVQHHTGLPKG